MKFTIGDRVRVKGCFGGINLKGKTGTIISIGKICDYGVEFDEPIGAVGHSCGGMGKKGFCRWGYEIELESVYNNCNNKIVITTDGKTTLARLFENGKVTKTATAICSPDDEYNFITGAELSFERLIERKPVVGGLYKVIGNKGNYHCFAIGEIVKCASVDKNGLSYYISEKTKKGQYVHYEDVELVNEPIENHFVPHLKSTATSINYGEIGKETKYIDAVGRKLYTGDVVEIFNKNGKSFGDAVIVTSDVKQFVMGIRSFCNEKDGSIEGGWKIIKKRSYKEVKNGEVIDEVQFITEEQQDRGN